MFDSNQTYTGTTTITGTLQLGSGGTTGSVSSSSDIVNNGALIVNRSDAITLGDISGNGTLTKQAAGTLTLTGDTTFSSVSVTGGGLQVGSGGTTGTIAGDIALSTGTLLNFTRSGTMTYAGDVSGGGDFDNDGTGTTILTGAFTNTGTFAISSGTVQVGNGGSGGSVDLDIINNGTLVWNKSADTDYAHVISGSGSLTKSGSGRVEPYRHQHLHRRYDDHCRTAERQRPDRRRRLDDLCRRWRAGRHRHDPGHGRRECRRYTCAGQFYRYSDDFGQLSAQFRIDTADRSQRRWSE
ncbi:MAG: hypothetical protein WDN31_01580 [Hyphomicrobium sp.]